MENIVDRFIRYAKIDTESQAGATQIPSTQKQFDLARLLQTEVTQLQLEDIQLTDTCFLSAKLPSNLAKEVPAIAFFAHVDTSPDDSGANVQPQIWENYDGKDIPINPEQGIILSPSVFPTLNQYIGHTIITADGTTLLGADDKAAVAEIMYLAEYLVEHPEIPHGDIWFCFTPDEEVGLGVGQIDISHVKADFGYTLDAESAGELQYETFNATSLVVNIHGRQVHPSTAKNKMINALQLIAEFNNALPYYERPEYTEYDEGFYHLVSMGGTVEQAQSRYIIREHNQAIFNKRKEYVTQVAQELQAAYPEATVDIELEDTYYNMGEKIKPVYHIVELAEDAMRNAGLTPTIFPFRGGTDGAAISFQGIPCPNLFAGWHNAHGKYEYVTKETMLKAVEVIENIVQKVAKM